MTTLYEGAFAKINLTLDVLGKRVPEDIMIAGFDDVQHASLMIPQLTTIHQPCSDIAELAVCRILSRIGNPNQTPIEILLPSPLIERGSTRVLRLTGAVPPVLAGRNPIPEAGREHRP